MLQYWGDRTPDLTARVKDSKITHHNKYHHHNNPVGGSQFLGGGHCWKMVIYCDSSYKRSIAFVKQIRVNFSFSKIWKNNFVFAGGEGGGRAWFRFYFRLGVKSPQLQIRITIPINSIVHACGIAFQMSCSNMECHFVVKSRVSWNLPLRNSNSVWPRQSANMEDYLSSGTYVSVLAAGGCSFKITPTHRSIDDTLMQPKFVGWLSRAIKSKIFCRSTVKDASI